MNTPKALVSKCARYCFLTILLILNLTFVSKATTLKNVENPKFSTKKMVNGYTKLSNITSKDSVYQAKSLTLDTNFKGFDKTKTYKSPTWGEMISISAFFKFSSNHAVEIKVKNYKSAIWGNMMPVYYKTAN